MALWYGRATDVCPYNNANGKRMLSFFVFYGLMFERTFFSRRGSTAQRRAHHRETIPARQIIMKPFPLRKQTNPTNPTNPDFQPAQKVD